MALMSVVDHETLARTRKSLYVSSIFTMVVANSSFLTQSLTVFGLSIAIDQRDIIAVGKLSVGVLLSIFCIQAVSGILDLVKKIQTVSFEKWNEEAKREISQIELEIHRPNEFHRQEMDMMDPWDEAYYEERMRRLGRSSKFEKFLFGYKYFSLFLFDYGMVIFISVIATLCPNSLTTAVNFLR